MANIFGSPELLGAWERAHAAPEPVIQAEITAKDMAFDALGRQELNLAEEKIRKGWEERNLALGLAGAGIAGAVGLSYVVPWYRGGRYAASVRRAAAARGAVPRGRWTSNPNAEEVPTEWLRDFATHDRADISTSPLYGRQRVNDLKRQIGERGFDDALIVDVSVDGRGILFDGNHRLQAALELGLDRVPVRAVVSSPGAHAGEGVSVGVLDGLRANQLLRPSQVFREIPPLIPERFLQVLPEDVRAATLTDWVRDALRAAGLSAPKKEVARASVEKLGSFARGGGFTWDPRTAQIENWSGFGVATVPGYTVQIPVEEFTSAHAIAYLRFAPGGQTKTVAQHLADNPKNAIGAWVEPINKRDYVWLDISSVLESKEAAYRLGGAMNERAVFNFQTFLSDRIAPIYKRGGSRFDESAPERWYRNEALEYSTEPIDVRKFPEGRVSGQSRARDLQNQPYEGDTIMAAMVAPVQAARQFGATSREAAQRIFDEMASRPPMARISGDDLKTEGMLEYLESLQVALRNGTVPLAADYPTFHQFQEFADVLGLQKPRLISGTSGETFRPMFKAIEEGRFQEVLDDLAIQINNVFRLLDDDVFYYAFYPYMHNATMAGSLRAGTPPIVMSPLSGILSAGAAPIPEVQSLSQLFKVVSKAGKVKNGVLVDTGGSFAYPSAYESYFQLVNNPDWLTNRVKGLATKTYVYSMLKMNPRMAHALVIDRVDASARLAAREMSSGWQWRAESAMGTVGPELALGGFAERVVASTLGVPPSAVQENVWAIWRVLRDLQVPSGGPSRQSGVRLGRKTLEDFVALAKMPKAHRELLEQNIARLENEVLAGGPASRYWEFQTPEAYGQKILVPKTDMPIDGYLPPRYRNEANAAALEGAIGNAEEIGRGLAAGAPWAPIALQLSIVGGAFGGIFGASQPAEASVGAGAAAAGGVSAAGAGVGAGVGALTGALTGKSRAVASFLRGPVAKRIFSYEHLTEMVNRGILQSGYGRGVNKNYGALTASHDDILNTSTYPSGRFFSEKVARTEPLTPGQQSRIDQIVREEVEALIWRDSTIDLDGELIKLADETIVRSEPLSRWGTVGYNPFTNRTEPVQPIFFARILRDGVNTIQQRHHDVAVEATLRRIMQEMPEIADAVKITAGAEYGFVIGREGIFKKFMEDAVPVIQVWDHNLQQIARDGKFLNQFLARDSGGDIVTSGTSWPMYRVLKEYQFAGINLEQNAFQRPAYGYFALPDTKQVALNAHIERIAQTGEHYTRRTGPHTILEMWEHGYVQLLGERASISHTDEFVQQYGNVAIVLKPKYKNTATFTIGDSLNGSAYPNPTSEITTESLYMSNFQILADPHPSGYDFRYIEGQFKLGEDSPLSFIDHVVILRGEPSLGSRIKSWLGSDIEIRYVDWR